MGKAIKTNPPATKEPWSDFVNPLFIECITNNGTKIITNMKYKAIKKGRIHSLH